MLGTVKSNRSTVSHKVSCMCLCWVFGRLMSGQLSKRLACKQASTLRHVAVNDCFIFLRQWGVVATWGVLLCVCVCAHVWVIEMGWIKQLWSKDGWREVPHLTGQMDGLMTVTSFYAFTFVYVFCFSFHLHLCAYWCEIILLHMYILFYVICWYWYYRCLLVLAIISDYHYCVNTTGHVW